MSGQSHWTTIKHRKGAAERQRGRLVAWLVVVA